jgi:MHS family proline/betaine transporter-like MFS transporter
LSVTAARPPRSLTIQVLAASAGNALEFYDFTVFAYFAPQISVAFFRASTPSGSLLATWGTFAAAFVARPLGALWLGGYADRRGRKAAMTACILLMTLGTFLMAVMPGYGSIGLVAPFGILAARLIQGFAAGGEFGGATAFMMEHASARRGFLASFQFTSQSISAMAGAGAALAVNQFLSPADVQGWGFRLPFFAGLLIGPVGLYLRRHADETPVFLRTGPALAPIEAAVTRYPGRILLAACTVAAGTVLTYLRLYLPTYAQHELHMAATSSYTVPFAAAFIGLLFTPATAILSDRIGRFWPAMVGVALLAAAGYPAFLLIDAFPTLAMLMAVILGLSVLQSVYAAPIPALMGEMFPPDVRGVGMSVGYSFGIMVFGGVTPLVSTWLISVTGHRTAPGLYLAAAGTVTLLALTAIRRFVPLRAHD